jgi:hypothetical protein
MTEIGEVESINGLVFKHFGYDSTDCTFSVSTDTGSLDALAVQAVYGNFVPMTVGKYMEVEDEKVIDGIVYKAQRAVERSVDEHVRLSEISQSKFKIDLTVTSGLESSEVAEFNGEYEFLRYNVGGHFKVHTDRSRHVGHTHTVCIYPPQQVTGGELVLMTPNSSIGKDVVVTMPPDTWLVVVFPIELPHASNPITSGCKYMFKGTCSMHSIAQRGNGTIKFRMGYDSRNGQMSD